ncbi:VWA domain-containing protein [Candidatus Pacearchaeota archaeon]|nr:VWA domain-containing protein [Candidatus Pacearchaeota archaeon]
MTVQDFRQKLSRQQHSIGLVGGSVSVEEYDEMEHNIEAYISPEGWNTVIKIKKGFNPIKDKRQKAYARKKKIKDGLEKLVLHVGGLHEPAHWELPQGSGRGCPFDIYNHDKILEAVKSALPKDKKAHAMYVANAFEDTLINPRCKEFNGDYSGQVLFWDSEGLVCEQKGQKGFTPFYEAFVKLNMYLWGDNTDRALLKRHYRGEEKVDEAVANVIKELNLPKEIKDTRRLFDKNKWAGMAHIFTKNLAHLLEELPTERLSAYSEESSGEGEQKQEAGNGVEQKMKTREGKEEIALGRYSSNESLSKNFTDFEQLDALYRKLAREIPVKVESITRENSLKITPLNYRAYDEERDVPTQIKPTKLMIGENGLTFGVPDQPLAVSARSKIQRRSFPDFKMMLIDNSGSMREASDGSKNIGRTSLIPWGDRSKYHYALLGFYGVENFLQRQGIAQYIKHGVALFSSQTRYKEGNFSDLDSVRKHVLHPDWGGTSLDANVLKKSLEGKQSFMLSISDGEIQNWDEERDSVKNLLENNYFAHLQIGNKTQFSSDLESWGKPVFYVSSGEDLAKLMVEATHGTYRRFTRE